MIANIRMRSSGYSKPLCQLDLMRFSEEQVRERMRVRGIEDDAFFICGFENGNFLSIISCLSEPYPSCCILVVSCTN